MSMAMVRSMFSRPVEITTPESPRSRLDWNTPSVDFYKAQGAVPLDEWTVFRLTDDALTTFAGSR